MIVSSTFCMTCLACCVVWRDLHCGRLWWRWCSYEVRLGYGIKTLGYFGVAYSWDRTDGGDDS